MVGTSWVKAWSGEETRKSMTVNRMCEVMFDWTSTGSVRLPAPLHSPSVPRTHEASNADNQVHTAEQPQTASNKLRAVEQVQSAGQTTTASNEVRSPEQVTSTSGPSTVGVPGVGHISSMTRQEEPATKRLKLQLCIDGQMSLSERVRNNDNNNEFSP